MLCSIYVIECVSGEDAGKKYVGSTVSDDARIKAHFTALRRGTHHSSRLQAAYDKAGEAAFSYSVVETVDEPLRTEREQYWIDTLNAAETGFNVAPFAGEVMTGRRHSETARRKMSDAKKGRPIREAVRLARLGRRHTPETCAKRNASLTGKRRSKETCARISEVKTGVPRTPEAIAAMTGLRRSDEARRNMSLAAKAAWARRKDKTL